MIVRRQVSDWWQGLRALGARDGGWDGREVGALGGDAAWGELAAGLGRGLTGRSLELTAVQEEVAAEARGQVVIVGRSDAANRGLLARLRQEDPLPTGGPVYREGFFALLTLPDDPAADEWTPGSAAGWWPGEFAEADALIYVADAATAGCADARWCARLRGLGLPLVVVAWAGDGPAATRALADLLHLPAAGQPVPVAAARADNDEADTLALAGRLLDARPRLAPALAREAPACRELVARRVIRQNTVMAALLGAEPIPLLDLPLQAALSWRLALQLAAIYGRPGLDYRSHEMVAAIATTLSARLLAQQALKLAPVVGWLASAGLSGLGVWLLGQALLRHYGAERPPEEGYMPPPAAELKNAARPIIRLRLRRGEGVADG